MESLQFAPAMTQPMSIQARVLGLPVRARRIDEDDVQVQVQQVRHRGKDLTRDFLQRLAQEVHPRYA